MVNKRFFYKVLIFCVLLVCLIGCASPKQQTSLAFCKYILETGIEPTTFNGVEKREITNWILQRYPIEADAIEESVRPDGYSYTWFYNDVQYSTVFVDDRFVKLEVILGRVKLSGENFTTCLGDPDFYTAEYIWISVPQLMLNLWYVDEGIIIRHIVIPEQKPFQTYVPEIKEDTRFPIVVVSYMDNKDLNSMAYTLYGPDPYNVDRELKGLQTWESWDTLQIQIDPMLQ